MNIKENIKKIITGITAFFTTITTKVFAKTNTDIQKVLNVLDDSYNISLYGIERPWQYTVSNGLLKICEFIAIPLILIIGAIIFIQRKKNIKSKNLKKAIIIISIVYVVAFIAALIIPIIYNQIYF
mgnify:FL=1